MRQAYFIFFLLPSPQAAPSLKKENYIANTNRYMKYFFNSSFILCGLCCFAMSISLSNEIELELNGSEYMHSILSGDDQLREQFNTMMDPRTQTESIKVPILSGLTMRVMKHFIELLYRLEALHEPDREAKEYINNSNKLVTYHRGGYNA